MTAGEIKHSTGRRSAMAAFWSIHKNLSEPEREGEGALRGTLVLMMFRQTV